MGAQLIGPRTVQVPPRVWTKLCQPMPHKSNLEPTLENFRDVMTNRCFASNETIFLFFHGNSANVTFLGWGVPPQRRRLLQLRENHLLTLDPHFFMCRMVHWKVGEDFGDQKIGWYRIYIISLGGGFKYVLCSSLPAGNDPIWQSYFSDGSKPPTSFGSNVFFFRGNSASSATFFWDFRSSRPSTKKVFLQQLRENHLVTLENPPFFGPCAVWFINWKVGEDFGDQKICWYRIWVVVSNMCLFSSLPGEMIQFDDHIFQMGWNHQPGIDRIWGLILYVGISWEMLYSFSNWAVKLMLRPERKDQRQITSQINIVALRILQHTLGIIWNY